MTEDIQCQKSMGRQDMIAEADDAEQYGQDDKAGHLDWLAANRVDRHDAGPVTGNVSCDCENQVPHGSIVEALVHVS